MQEYNSYIVLSAQGYVPSIEHVLHCRLPTTGICEYLVDIQGVVYRFVDTGGERSERRKWIHVMEGVD